MLILREYGSVPLGTGQYVGFSTDAEAGVDTTKPPSMWQMTKLMADSELREAGNKVRSPVRQAESELE